ncbi:hypothetical protein UA08_01361 [Talaromyces atroroseus]|uniref:DUF7779 domain-containing protein n=1 Tax=Talaromyces atroroseus TaxID=1441469 RepID=A0A1Q5Q9W3_TALAT|nr:hypothetical protein UA08_01361 [Talaromyces atroroseus]OKL62715.1 hypothetical protein UA08_01361 [Talaromyces atroroseus]
MNATTTTAAAAAAGVLSQSSTADENGSVGETYDRFYIASWEAALAHCTSTLEKNDRQRALKIKTADDFRMSLRQLRVEHPDQNPQEVISMLFPAIEHYETFAGSFVALMAHAVDVSMMWGLLFLVVKLSLESKGTTERIHRMLRSISNKLERLNEILTTVSDFAKFKAQMVEINREIFMLWFNIIMIFRTEDNGDEFSYLQKLTVRFDSTFKNTEEQVDSLIQHIGEMALIADRQSHMVDLTKYYQALALQADSKSASIPFHTIPVPRNARFFGRTDVLQEIDEYFFSSNSLSGIHSLAIYGLGGVGKTQAALEYAWKKQEALDAVIWVPAESEIAIQQALSHVALTVLKLTGADSTSHKQNAVLVMQWVNPSACPCPTPGGKRSGFLTNIHIDAKWLLIYDNVETPLIFESYWPVSNHGSILITTRKLGLTTQPIAKRTELQEFDADGGRQFLIHNIFQRNIVEGSQEYEKALEISVRLSGHALAISQMAALILVKGLSLEKFLVMYDKHSKRMHRDRKNGWKYPGYNHAIDTVWELSFSELDQDARTCLGILSFLMPDSIPQEIFEASDMSMEQFSLQFCEDEYMRSEVFETLANLALIRINHDTDSITIHRLVQSEFLFQMTLDDRQDEFDATIRLLLDKFPSRGQSVVDERNWKQAERYLPQVLSAFERYCDTQKEQHPLRSSLNFLNLICDTLWFLATNDSAGNRDFVLSVAYLAWDKWDNKEEAPLIHAYILARGSDQDLWNGEFKNGVEKAHDALELALQYLEPDNERVVQYNSDYGIAFGSDGNYKRGADYLSRAEEFFNADPERYGIAKGILINANISRNSYCNGDFEDAEVRLNRTLEMSREMGSLYWEALIHFAFGSLGVRSGNLELADSHLVLANETIEKFGPGRNIQLDGMYNYIGGRIRLGQGKFQESIDFFKKAIAIDDIQMTPRGYRARHLYALSRAQAAHLGNEKLSKETEKEAIKLAGRNLRIQKSDSGSETREEYWEAFDLLIRIVER